MRNVSGRMPWAMSLWPGLPQLWYQGGWSGLTLAMAFTLLLNVLLAASFVWTDWLGVNLRLAGWSAVGLLWMASVWAAPRQFTPAEDERPDELAKNSDDDRTWLHQAQEQYLQGNWFEAQRLLNRRLARCVSDVDARLLLATLWRHLGKWDDAEKQLSALERFDEAAKWRHEIDRERRLIARGRDGQADISGTP